MHIGIFSFCFILMNSVLLVQSKLEMILSLDTYTHFEEKLLNGAYCDFFIWPRSCSPRFNFCLDTPQSTCDTKSMKVFGPFYRADPVLHFQHDSELIGGVQNPMRFVLPTISDHFRIRLVVYQDNSKDLLGYLNSQFKFNASGSEDEAKFKEEEIHDSKTGMGLKFRIKVWCQTDFHGPHCQNFCRESDDDINGHYTCNQSGDLICRPGWTNVAAKCTERVSICVSNNPCQNGAGCYSGSSWNEYTCICTQGFTGPNCSEASTATTFTMTSTSTQSPLTTQGGRIEATTHQPDYTIGPIPDWPLALEGCLTKDDVDGLKESIIKILKKIYGSSATIRVKIKTENAITPDYFYITLIHPKIRVNHDKLKKDSIMSHLFRFGLQYLNTIFPAKVYQGKWMRIKKDCKSNDFKYDDYSDFQESQNGIFQIDDSVKENVIQKLRLELLSIKKMCNKAT